MKKIYSGNAVRDSQETRGWFIGHFVKDKESLLYTNDVEIKYGTHKKGESRDDWSVNQTATTMSLVVSGAMRMIFKDEEILLKSGDYFVSKPKVPHKYMIEEDALVITVRWPSLPQDHQNK